MDLVGDAGAQGGACRVRVDVGAEAHWQWSADILECQARALIVQHPSNVHERILTHRSTAQASMPRRPRRSQNRSWSIDMDAIATHAPDLEADQRLSRCEVIRIAFERIEQNEGILCADVQLGPQQSATGTRP